MSFIERVANEKKDEVARKKAQAPLRELERRVKTSGTRDFKAALSGGEKIIAEVKKKSPRVQSFAQAPAMHGLAALYEANGAAAVSIVTDEANFGTSLSDARRVRAGVSLPVLVKDFVIDPYQIFEARLFDADAVLLIGRILGRGELASFAAIVRDLGMTPLFEAHTVDDVEKALDAGAEIVGINNRDLGTLEVSLDTTRRLIDHVPDGVLAVSESGIYRRSEIEEFSRLGVDAFLIGGALLESNDPGQLLHELLGGGIGKDNTAARGKLGKNV